MAPPGANEAWLTFGEDDADCENVLLLSASLRYFRTNRKILVLTGPRVTTQMKERLDSWCDTQLEVHGPESWMELDWETWLKVHAFSLTFLTKCCFLPSHSLVLNNCDDIFDYDGAVALRAESGSPFLLKPSRPIYQQLIKLTQERLLNGFARRKETFAKLLGDAYIVRELENKYYFRVDIQSRENAIQDTWNLMSPVIVQLDNGSRLPAAQAAVDKMTNTLALLPFQEDLLNFRKHLTEEIKARQANGLPRTISGPTLTSEPIAIIGMSGRFPGANNMEEFWNLLLSGGDGTGPVPSGRWGSQETIHLNTAAIADIRAGFLKCPINEFDEKMFGMSAEEATFVDPQHRILLEVVWEALEDAAISPLSLKETNTAVFTGIWKRDYKDLVTDAGTPASKAYRVYMGCGFGQSAARISHLLRTFGPSSCSEAACSASMVAVGKGVLALRNGETNLALVGGVNLLTKAFVYEAFKGLCSIDGRSRPFDASANGFCRAEGVGALILKRLSDSVRDGDRIYAIIRGYGASQEGPSKSAGTPTVLCESMAMDLALADGGVSSEHVSFIETHGTGTPVGDPLEINAITKAYGSPHRREPLILGAVKANIGHTESCSGITGIIKTVLSLQNELIPPHPCLKELNSKINLEGIPAIIPVDQFPWPKSAARARLAGVSSFGITGTDAHVILEEAPTITKQVRTSCSFPEEENILTLSAKSLDALNALVRKYKEYMEKGATENIVDIAYSTNYGRSSFKYRLFLTGKTMTELSHKLENGHFELGEAPSERPRICFLFTGQGSQYHGMGKTLYQSSPLFKYHFDICDKELGLLYGIHIKEALWSSNEVDATLLHESLYSQTAIFVIEYCLAKLWESWGIRPDCVLGHSLGEFAAATIAGIISLHDALRLVGMRSILINRLPQGKMLVVKGDLESTNKLLGTFQKENEGSWLDIAATNTSTQTTVAGSVESISLFAKFCVRLNVKTHVLDATHAFHSRHMDPMLNEYKQFAESLSFAQPRIPYVSGVEGKLVTNVDANYWVRHTRERVRFQEGTTHLFKETGCKLFLEIGPQPVLSGIVLKNLEEMETFVTCIPSLQRNTGEWSTIVSSLGKLYLNGFNINWQNFYQHVSKQKISLPFYAFQRSKFWIEVDKTRSTGYFHPLLGSPLKNPTTAMMFQNYLRVEEDSYIVDHRVGSHILLPAAAFMEMCLVGGLGSVFGIKACDSFPAAPLVVRDFVIRNPLEVREGQMMELQTICTNSAEEKNCLEVSIYSRRGGGGGREADEWSNNASALFDPNIDQETHALSKTVANLQNLKLRIGNEIEEGFYKTLSLVGYNFGHKFQTLARCWRSESGETLCEVSIREPEERRPYIMHPVLIDSMIQAFLLCSAPQAKSLHLPVAVSNFTVFRPSADNSTFFAHAYKEGERETTVLLYDAEGGGGGLPIALMRGVQFVETSLERVERSLAADKLSPPPMFKEEWKPSSRRRPGKALSSQLLNSLMHTLTNTIQSYENKPSPDALATGLDDQRRLEESVSFVIMKAFLELGWSYAIGETLELRSVMKALKVKNEFYFLLCRSMEMLSEDGYITIKNNDQTQSEFRFVVEKEFPNAEKLNRALFDNYFLRAGHEWEWEALLIWNDKFSKFLTGVEKLDEFLYPSDSEAYFCADTLLTKSEGTSNMYNLLQKSLDAALAELSARLQADGTIRVLELSNGNGQATSALISALQKCELKFHYILTHSATTTSVDKVKAEFASVDHKVLEYAVLNIEDDPKLQGFTPHSFDLILAPNVLHHCGVLADSLKNIMHLMAESAILILLEPLRPQRIVDLVLGGLNTYSNFKDYEVRGGHYTLSSSGWQHLLSKEHFIATESFEDQLGHFGIIVAEAPTAPPPYETTGEQSRRCWLIFDNEAELAEGVAARMSLAGKEVVRVCHGSKYGYFGSEAQIRADSKGDMDSLLSHLSEKQVEGIIYLWSVNPTIDTNSLTRSFLHLLQSIIKQNISPSLYLVTEGQVYIGDQEPTPPIASPLLGLLRTFRTENPFTFCKSIDLDPDSSLPPTDKVDELELELWKLDKEPLIAYRKGRRYVARFVPSNFSHKYNPLDTPRGDRFELLFPDSNTIGDLRFGVLGRQTFGENEVEVKVEAWGLNFRDIFSVLKPSEQFKSINSIGNDFAGVVASVGRNVKTRVVGDPVFGLNSINSGLPSHVILNENAVVSIPRNYTYAQAATLPTVFATAYWCLIKVAKLGSGDWVLIHTGSGGVGLCAIQIARSVGAVVLATAGSKRKRAYLRLHGVEHVFGSRDLSFAEAIKEATPNGRGVDVVLNSLTGPGFKEATLGICAPNARFIEMSKLNVWTPDHVNSLRPDVLYSVEDLSTQRCDDLLHKLSDFLSEGKLQALPYTTFKATHIRDALTYLEKAKHIGKVVCLLPNPEGKNSSLFNGRSTYLVTGGTRGIGLEVAKWMVSSGARFIVVCGRNEASQECLEVVKTCASVGVTLSVQRADVGNYEDCKRLFDKISSFDFPPLRGVMHAAGCLADATIPNQNWDKFQITLQPKMEGAWNLHSLTMGYNLEHFVLYSSCVAIVGAPGQCNHAAANSFLDSFAHYRHSMGLVCTSVNWGQWGEVGVASGIKIPGFSPMPTVNALLGLEKVLSSHEVQGAVIDGESHAWRNMFMWAKDYFEELQALTPGNSDALKLEINSEKFWEDLGNAANFEERYSVVLAHVSPLAAYVLKLDQGEKLEAKQDFQDLGMDSFMSIDLRNRIQKLLGKEVTLTTSELMDAHNMDILTRKILEAIYGGAKVVSLEEQVALAKQDCQLWEHIQGDGKECKLSKISRVLLTGVTGSLGPYILRELARKSQIHKIICLLRPSKRSSGEERLAAHLKELKLLKEIDMDKVEVVLGNVVEEFLGLSEEVYNGLSESIDAVFHSAVCSNHLAKYTKEDLKYSGIRAVNVIGTQRILEFASNKRTKWIYQASSLLSIWTDKGWPGIGDENVELKEDFQSLVALDETVDFGYAISKFVSDQLDGIAVRERSMPLKVFGFPKIMGENGSGRQLVTRNHFFVKFLEYLIGGVIPDLEVPLQLLSVDVCAELSVKMFFMEESKPGYFVCYNPHARVEKDISALVEELGYELRIAKEVGRTFASGGEDAAARRLTEFSKDDPEIRILINEYIERVGVRGEFNLLRDERVREWMRKEYSYSPQIVPFEEFSSRIKDSGDNSLLHNWEEFYTSEKSLYRSSYPKAINNSTYLDFLAKPNKYLSKFGKLKKLIPDFAEIIIDPLETLRADFRFVVQNASKIFSHL